MKTVYNMWARSPAFLVVGITWSFGETIFLRWVACAWQEDAQSVFYPSSLPGWCVSWGPFTSNSVYWKWWPYLNVSNNLLLILPPVLSLPFPISSPFTEICLLKVIYMASWDKRWFGDVTMQDCCSVLDFEVPQSLGLFDNLWMPKDTVIYKKSNI